MTLVAGPPCGGKSTFVRDHAEPGDLIVDWDLLLMAITPGGHHMDPGPLRPYLAAARDAILARLRTCPWQRAWIINSAPSRTRRESYRTQYGAGSVVVMAPREVCLTRARTQRPGRWTLYIDRWFERYEADPSDEVIYTG